MMDQHRSARGALARFAPPLAVAAVAFALCFVGIDQVGYGNAYYAAAVRSMTQSIHNFFFVSFDPAGVVSVDKPPLGLWTQAVFALIFGFHGWVLMLPQALSCAGSAYLIYRMTEKYFGRPAAAISGITFAVTPVVVAVSRNNTMDMQLVFVLLLAVRYLFLAIETGRWKPLLLASLLVGLGFNIKMLQAYLILPAAGLTYLLFCKKKAIRAIIASAASLAVITAVSLSWAAVVDLTPSGERPYVGSSTDNTVMELIIGHNGAERLYGQSMGGGRQDGFGSPSGQTGRSNQPDAMMPHGSPDDVPSGGTAQPGNAGQPGSMSPQGNLKSPSQPDGTAPSDGTPQASGLAQPGSVQPQDNSGTSQPDGDHASDVARWMDGGRRDGTGQPGGFLGRSGGPGGGFGGEIGQAGWLRLFEDNLFGQASWLLPFAVIALLSFVGRPRWHERTMAHAALCFWGIWLITCALFFSFAGFYHRYYLCMLAPPLAVLTGTGISNLLRAVRDRDYRRAWLLPAGIAASATLAWRALGGYPSIAIWLRPTVVALAGLSGLALSLVWLRPTRIPRVATAILTSAVLLIAPAWWSITTLETSAGNATLPSAGPASNGMGAMRGMGNMYESNDGLQQYLVSHYAEGTYLVVARGTSEVADLIINTGLPAVAYGGFVGSDEGLTLEQFKELVAQGTIRYFLMSGLDGRSGEGEIERYVQENATPVSSSEYGGSGRETLYLFA